MSCSCAGDLANIYAAIGNLEGQFNYITGNTMTNYNQLSRIVSQQSNIYNTIYYGLGNLATGNLIINNSYVINGNLSIPTGNLLIASGNILSTVGNLVLSNGNLGITAGNITMSSGNLGITTGNIVMGNGNIGISRGNLIMSNGSIGIKRTNPQYEMDINGSANISQNVSFNTFSYSSDYFTTPTKMLGGIITIPSTGSNSGYTVAVTFSVAFSSRPIVVFNSDNVNFLSSVSSVTTTGFTAIGRNVGGTTSSGTGNWFAIGAA